MHSIMSHVILYTITSVIVVSLVAVIAAIPLLVKKKVSQQILLSLLSISVGTLLATVFFHLLPEAFGHALEEGMMLSVALYALLGFLLFFILEKFIHWRHSRKEEDGMSGHSHAYHIAPVNLIGDAVHNFIDGLVIAGAYVVNIGLGVAATVSVLFHELPQELADFGVLLYSGMSRKKALLFNFLSAVTAILGAVVGLVLAQQLDGFTGFIIPFTAGIFIYIAASNLLPQLHHHSGLKESVLHVLAILAGIAIIVAVTMLVPRHG